MIVEIRNKKPKLSFGLGVIEKTVNSGATVFVYLNNVYNTEFYTTEIKPISGITIAKINANTFSFTPTITASFTFILEVTNTETGQVLKSNKLTLISL